MRRFTGLCLLLLSFVYLHFASNPESAAAQGKGKKAVPASMAMPAPGKSLPASFLFGSPNAKKKQEMKNGDLIGVPSETVTFQLANGAPNDYPARAIEAIKIPAGMYFWNEKAQKHLFMSNRDYVKLAVARRKETERLLAEKKAAALEQYIAERNRNDPFMNFLDRLGKSEVGKQMAQGFMENLAGAIHEAWNNPQELAPEPSRKPSSTASSTRKPAAAPNPPKTAAASPKPTAPQRVVVTGRALGVAKGTQIFYETVSLFPIPPADYVYTTDDVGTFSITLKEPSNLRIIVKDRERWSLRVNQSRDIGAK